jgi:hypothetical protein
MHRERWLRLESEPTFRNKDVEGLRDRQPSPVRADRYGWHGVAGLVHSRHIDRGAASSGQVRPDWHADASHLCAIVETPADITTQIAGAERPQCCAVSVRRAHMVARGSKTTEA